jgi:hypothetical protein
MGDSARRYGEELQNEMQRRRLRFVPIDWR